MNLTYLKAERLRLKSHLTLNEKWVQDRIAEDPSILGLGDLVLRDKERTQPRAGRLDLLFQDIESKRRYEVELQLGSTDESHIIRTIEYWDIERKRYPQYDHCAVLIAEDVTSRFLNVVSIINGVAPLIVLQMQAYIIKSEIILIFTKVLDEMSRGLVDEDEDAEAAPSDRSYWEKRSNPTMLGEADKIIEIAKTLDENFNAKYNKFYIGFERKSLAFNFIILRPQKNQIKLEVGLQKSSENDALLDAVAATGWDYDTKWRRYRISLKPGEISQRRTQLEALMKMSLDERSE